MSRSARRKGSISVLFAMLLVFMLGMVAFAVDIGMMSNDRALMQQAADASALAGINSLVRGEITINEDVVNNTAERYFGLNAEDFEPTIRVGHWDSGSREFYEIQSDPEQINAIQIQLQAQRPTYFGRVFGLQAYTATVSAIAIGGTDADDGPRDIVFMIDQTTALLGPSPDIYASGESYPTGYPLNAKRALKEAMARFFEFVDENCPDVYVGITGFSNFSQQEHSLSRDWASLNSVFDISRPEAFVYSHEQYNFTTPPGEPYHGNAKIERALSGADQGELGGYEVATGTGARSEAKKVLVLISDGNGSLPSADPGGKAVLMANSLASQDVDIYTITLGEHSDLMDDLPRGEGVNRVVATDGEYEEMVDQLEAALSHVAGDAPQKPTLVK